METNEITKTPIKTDNFLKDLKKAWNWVWNSDSILSWVVALLLIFVIVKFIFFPGLSFIMGTSLPIAGVESSSMDHQIVSDDSGILSLCGDIYSGKESISFDKYWDLCGDWYEKIGISKEEFINFPLKNGFSKGDIVLVWGRFSPKTGDIIIFRPNADSTAPRPIVHRIVSIKDNVIQTKGDHNKEQLSTFNNQYKTDETHITKNQLIGKVIFKIPYLGWFKIWVTDLVSMFTK